MIGTIDNKFLVMDLSSIESFLWQSEIPIIKKMPKTFLEIAKQPHYENVISNIYAFYFNTNKEHLLGDLFISSLIQLATLKCSDKEFYPYEGFDVKTEYNTKKNGRIDILISDEKQHFIIENKIYHNIDNNDLKDYWNSVVHSEDINRSIGIVMGLGLVDISGKKGSENFINITHLEFINQVMANLGPYLLNANEKFVVFLKDLAQNIINLSTGTMEEKEIQFCLENKEKIKQVVSLNNEFKEFIKSEVKKASNNLDGLDFQTLRTGSNLENRVRHFVSKVNNDLMYLIKFEALLNGSNELDIRIKLTNSAVEKVKSFKGEELSNDEESIKLVPLNDSKGNWAHFANKEYLLNDGDVSKLSSFIEDKIRSDFDSLFKKLEVFLSKTQ